jgi:putative membrane protein
VKQISLALALVGIAVATTLVGWFGVGRVADAVLSVGWREFGVLTLWQCLLFALLGVAWQALMPAKVAIWTTIWARAVRDSAGSCLPFSQIGGAVVGARAMTLQGVAWPLAAGSTIVDLTTEFLAQVGFAVFGLVILLAREPESDLTIPLVIGIVAALLAIMLFVWLQRGAGRVAAVIGRRIAGGWFEDAALRMDLLLAELTRLYARGWHVALGVVLHLLAWFGTGVGSWIAYRLIGVEIGLVSVLAIEGLLHGILAASFVVPGNLVVQEAAYAGLGTIFGLPPDVSLGVSLLLRARALAIGVPILLIWQLTEIRKLRRSGNG